MKLQIILPQQTPEDYSPAICLSRRSIRPPIARRSTAFLLASAIAGVSCMAATSTSAQAVHVVLAVAKYVALTTAFAEAVDKLAGAVAATYGTGRTITGDMACRRERSALRELVITLRDLEVKKRELHSRLDHALSPMSHWLEWQQVGTRAERVSVGILEITQQIEEQRESFADSAAVSRAYGSLLITFDAKQNLLRDLAAEMQTIDWTWGSVDRRDARRSAYELRPLAGAPGADRDPRRGD